MNWLDAQSIISAFGPYVAIAVATIVFLETAFILTSFLPGDSLLFLAGLAMANSSSWLPDWVGMLLIWLAAIGGSQVGYWLGAKIGPPLFRQDRNFILNPHVLKKTHDFFEKYGARAVILARFVPILRALIPMLAGISRLDATRFFRLNVLGATIWLVVFLLGGYLLGNVSLVKEHLEVTVLVIVGVTSLVLPIELLRDRIARRARR